MKRDSKSAIIRKSGILFAALLFLSSCGHAILPPWMTGEPDRESLRAPRVVSGPQAQGERDWPNLADVPESKPSYLGQEKAEGLTRRLVQDQKEAESEAARIGQENLGVVHLSNDPVIEMEGQTHPVGLLTAPDQPEPAAPKPFSALRP